MRPVDHYTPSAAKAIWAASLLTLSLLAGCGPGASGGASGGDAAEVHDQDYVVSPQVLNASRTSDGAVAISGRAAPDAIVRLQESGTQSWGVTAGTDGAWSFTVPLAATPRLLDLTVDQNGRAVHADGRVLVLPRPAVPAVVVRSGYGALAVATSINHPVIVSLDFDPGGGAIASGVARPKASVRLLIDGNLAGEGRADAAGRISIPAVNRPLSAGRHLIHLETADGNAEQTAEVSAPGPVGGGAVHAARSDGAWRIDWRTVGGGVQSTLIFDSAQLALTGSAG